VTGSTRDRLPSRARKDVDKYLLEDEKYELATRRHWAVLLEPTVKFLPPFLVGGWLLTLDPRNRLTSTVGLLVIIAALVYYGLRVTEWWMRHFIVSRRRVLLTSGVLVRTVTLLPLARITDLTWQETLLGNILGYGTFRFESAGQDQALRRVDYLPYPDEVAHQMFTLLFGTNAEVVTQPIAVVAPDGSEGTGGSSEPAPPSPRPWWSRPDDD